LIRIKSYLQGVLLVVILYTHSCSAYLCISTSCIRNSIICLNNPVCLALQNPKKISSAKSMVHSRQLNHGKHSVEALQDLKLFKNPRSKTAEIRDRKTADARERERDKRKARERRVDGCECPKKESGLAAASTTPNLLSSSRTATGEERKESSRIGMRSCLKIQRGKESIVRTYAAVRQRDLWMLLAKGSCAQVGLEVCGVLSSLSHNQICPRLFISLSLSLTSR
jgi:hypothetical protein